MPSGSTAKLRALDRAGDRQQLPSAGSVLPYLVRAVEDRQSGGRPSRDDLEGGPDRAGRFIAARMRSGRRSAQPDRRDGDSTIIAIGRRWPGATI